MASEGPERASEAPALTSLPRVEDLPSAPEGYDRERVREAFEAFRRHATQLQVQLRVFQSAGQSGVEPTGHAVRMDSLHLIRAAAEMADTIERDAQNASAAQFRRTEEEVTRKQRDLQQREAEVERYRNESERQRAEMLNAAKAEARQTVQEAEQQASQEITEAESRAARLLEQARHQATELTNSVRAEVEQTLEWARSQAGAIIHRAQDGAEQLLAAAGLGEEQTGRVAESIVDAARAAAEASRGGPGPEEGAPLRGPTPVREEPQGETKPDEPPRDEAPRDNQESAPPLSPPVSPGPSPPSPPEEHDTGPRPQGDRTDES
jgi:F0F1-type ATP synthase membrane subunit b/b'